MHKPIRPLTESDLNRFWLKVKKTDTCWLWTACVDKEGYGNFGIDGSNYRANRVSYAIQYGDPRESQVCHSCDNPTCVNPSHLWTGTTQDNSHDRDQKGRQAHGDNVNTAVLTEKDVKAIRRSNELQRVLADRYGVSKTAIAFIKRGVTWKHIKGKRRNTNDAFANSQTGIRGVSPCAGKYTATITLKGKQHYLGLFETVAEAAQTLEEKKNDI
jgi:hypothetical protein